MKKKGRFFSIEEVVSMKNIGMPAINNDGTKVAYQVTSTDWKDDRYVKELWIYDVTNHQHVQVLGKHENFVGTVKWSPNGRLLAVLIKTDHKKQIMIIDLDDMVKTQVSYHEKEVKDFIWASDNEGFYYISSAPSAKEKEIRDKKYGTFTYIDEDLVQNGLFYLDLNKGLKMAHLRYTMPEELIKKNRKDKKNPYYPSQLLNEKNPFYIYEMVTSPDGNYLAVSTAPSSGMENYDQLTLRLYDIKSEKFEKIDVENFAGDVLFSPDSSKLCFSKQSSWLKNNDLYIYDIKTKESSQIKTEIDENISVTQWIEKGMVLFYRHRTTSKYALLDNDHLTIELSKADTFYYGLHYSMDGDAMTYLERTSQQLPELYVNKKKVSCYSSVLKGRKIAQKKVISWQNADGIEIEGVLSTSSDFDDSKKYPLLVVIHGGPTATSYPFAISDRHYPIETFVEQGFIVIEPNYRGSAGYGEVFRSSNFKNLGIGDFEDVISGVDHLIDLGIVDADKIGVMGWSQGGYISAFCTTFSDRFKAISVGAGISNWETYYFNTDIPRFTKEYLDNVPFKDKKIYEKTSPMTYINQAKTPTLIQHGSADARVPVANAHELYRALKELDLAPKMVIYKNMGHGPSTPGLVRAINKQNFSWFCHHILNQPLEDYYLKSEE